MGEQLKRRIAPRPQSQPSTSPVQRQISEPSKCKVIDLTAESSSEDSLITGPQLELVEAPVTAPQGLASADVTSKVTIVQPPTSPTSSSSTGVLATPHDSSTTLMPQTSGDPPQVAVQCPVATDDAEDSDQTAQAKSDSTRSSGQSKKPTRFFRQSSSPFG